MVVAAGRWVLPQHFVVGVEVVVAVHALCSLILRRCGVQPKLSRLAEAAQAAQHRSRTIHRATQARRALTQRLVYGCVRVAGVAVALEPCLLVSVGTQATVQTV